VESQDRVEGRLHPRFKLDANLKIRSRCLQYLNLMMKKTNSDRLHDLCSQIAAERDHHKFLKLVEELNRVLEAKRPPQKPSRLTIGKELVHRAISWAKVGAEKTGDDKWRIYRCFWERLI
jgi:hypothetical protein